MRIEASHPGRLAATFGLLALLVSLPALPVTPLGSAPALAFLAGAAALGAAAIGLWLGRPWGRLLAIADALLLIGLGVPTALGSLAAFRTVAGFVPWLVALAPIGLGAIWLGLRLLRAAVRLPWPATRLGARDLAILGGLAATVALLAVARGATWTSPVDPNARHELGAANDVLTEDYLAGTWCVNAPDSPVEMEIGDGLVRIGPPGGPPNTSVPLHDWFANWSVLTREADAFTMQSAAMQAGASYVRGQC